MSEKRVAGREDGNTDVRERILDAAIAILREHGVRSLSQVQVARKAGVRQSHLTYYFPRRTDLLEAIAERVVHVMACDLRLAPGGTRPADPGATLERLAAAIAEEGHMRMFLGVIVEADADPDVRSILVRHTRRLEASLARALGGATADDRSDAAAPGEEAGDRYAGSGAGRILACLWGFGLYEFLVGAPADAGPPGTFLARLAGEGSAGPEP